MDGADSHANVSDGPKVYLSASIVNPDVHAPPPELQFLLLAARLDLDPASEAQLMTLARSGLDWDFVLVSAHHHRVLPLVRRTLGRLKPAGVPELPDMHRACYANARRNLAMTSELLRIVDSFDAHSIPCIPYKGPVLAGQIYGDISLRQFADLDVIVPHKDVIKARDLLFARGYVCTREEEKDITLRREGQDLDIQLELHWGVTTDRDPIHVPSDLLWSDLRSFSLAGRSVLTHSYENLLLIQCLHGAKHGWERLVWLCDIAEIVRSQARLRWHVLIERATAIGGRKALLLGLALGHELLGAAPPASVVGTIPNEQLTSLREQVKRWFASARRIPRGEHEQFYVRLQEHPADRIRVAYKHARRFLALTARDTESSTVPGSLAWVLYPMRIVRLVREYGIAPFTRFIGGIFQS